MAKVKRVDVEKFSDCWRGHGADCQGRARKAAEALLEFTDRSGRIPPERERVALRAAVLAAGKTWGAPRIWNLGHRMRVFGITADAR